jgi:hypothetical protein
MGTPQLTGVAESFSHSVELLDHLIKSKPGAREPESAVGSNSGASLTVVPHHDGPP